MFSVGIFYGVNSVSLVSQPALSVGVIMQLKSSRPEAALYTTSRKPRLEGIAIITARAMLALQALY